MTGFSLRKFENLLPATRRSIDPLGSLERQGFPESRTESWQADNGRWNYASGVEWSGVESQAWTRGQASKQVQGQWHVLK
ncbi:GL27015 [Drosophila persimilis]|uniref:GL27015 n=1 Tax=Drosophila persimilis TaxID=7234 RepID=B4H7F6_DROPE|nr:GL27015 [Drosophila persimilis]